MGLTKDMRTLLINLTETGEISDKNCDELRSIGKILENVGRTLVCAPPHVRHKVVRHAIDAADMQLAQEGKILI